jgi:hypothetical protein
VKEVRRCKRSLSPMREGIVSRRVEGDRSMRREWPWEEERRLNPQRKQGAQGEKKREKPEIFRKDTRGE